MKVLLKEKRWTLLADKHSIIGCSLNLDDIDFAEDLAETGIIEQSVLPDQLFYEMVSAS